MVMDITVKELKERMDRGDAPMLIDVREPHEHAICRIPGALLIPRRSSRDGSASSIPTRRSSSTAGAAAEAAGRSR